MPPQAPMTSGERTFWRNGCLVGGTFVMAMLALTCGFAWFAGRGMLGEWLLTRFVGGAVQRQADALGRAPPDFAAACRENGTRLESITPCAPYVGWILRSAPFFPGASVTVQRIEVDPSRDGNIRLGLPMNVSGPHGRGRLRFTVVYTERGLVIDSVRPW